MRGMYEVEEFPEPTWRRRLLVVACALTTVYVIMSNMLALPDGAGYKLPPTPEKNLCSDGQTAGCVGGMATVILAPPAPSTAAPATSPVTPPR